MAEVETQLKRSRAKIVRQRRALTQSLDQQHILIREALASGLGPTKVAKLTGLHISRVSQIRTEGNAKR